MGHLEFRFTLGEELQGRILLYCPQSGGSLESLNSPDPPFHVFFPKNVGSVSLFFLPFSALFWPENGSVPPFWNFRPTLFSSKLRF